MTLIELHYAKLLSLSKEILQFWNNSFHTEITFIAADLVWKETYSKMIQTVIEGKEINMIHDFGELKDRIETKAGDSIQKFHEVASMTLAKAEQTD